MRAQATPSQDDLFAFQIRYDQPKTAKTTVANVQDLYNGNISETFWRTQTDNTERGYVYRYDPLNRITDAYYVKNGQAPGFYNVTGITYDANGNIQTLKRNGTSDVSQILMDQLNYTYDKGNRLVKVSDESNNTYGFKDDANETTEYEYDANGNMTVDKNKGISAIEYNLLNLPVKVLFEDGGTIEYVYDANGTKLRKTVMASTSEAITTDYLDGYQYVNGKLAFYPHAEGYVKVNDDGSITYVYNYTDHLGNVRLSYADTNNDGTPEIVEENNYYPFGLKHKGYNNTANTLTDKYKYGYNGKEEQDELGLNWNDYGARNYDAALGRWFNVDPLAEEIEWISPYNFVQNNPLNRIDPDGRLDSPIYGRDGAFLGTDDQGLQGKAIIMDAGDFTQGMSHSDALSKSVGVEGLNDKYALDTYMNILSHYEGLKNRPDYDGVLTLSEANEWYKEGNGGSLYVNSAKIDLSPVETSYFENKKSRYYNFFTDAKGDYTTGRVYGSIKLSLLDKKGTVKLGGNNGYLDTYDFDIKENKINDFKTGLRNFGTRVGKIYAGEGMGYKIFTYGTGKVTKSEEGK